MISVSKYMLDVSTAVTLITVHLAILIPAGCCLANEPLQSHTRVKTYVEMMADVAFTNHDLFQRTTVRSRLDCARECASNEDCRSYSYSVSSDATSRTCSGHSKDRTASDPSTWTSSPGTKTFAAMSGMPEEAVMRNVALGKACSQSSTFPYSSAASNAVDGKNATNYNDGSCSHTHPTVPEDADVWWQVDLGQSYTIQSVIVTNREDAESQRLRDFDINVYSLNPETDSQAPASLCHHQTGTLSQVTQTFPCTLVGRFVRVINGGDDVLSLCEVQVMAFVSP